MCYEACWEYFVVITKISYVRPFHGRVAAQRKRSQELESKLKILMISFDLHSSSQELESKLKILTVSIYWQCLSNSLCRVSNSFVDALIYVSCLVKILWYYCYIISRIRTFLLYFENQWNVSFHYIWQVPIVVKVYKANIGSQFINLQLCFHNLKTI